MARPADPERRRRLLEVATHFVIERGLSESALRPMAAALGVRAPTLIHHFESKELLISQILNEVRRRLRQVAEGVGPGIRDRLEAVWSWASAPEHEDFYRTFFEIYGTALRRPDRYGEFLDHVVSDWLADDDDPVRATLAIAMNRGLLLDLLTTGDRERVDTAHAYATQWITSIRTGAPPAPRTPPDHG